MPSVTTTVSSTPCSKKHRIDRRAALACLALAGWPAAGAAQPATGGAAEVTQLRLERGDDGVYLSAAVQFELPAGVEAVLEKGIPVYFVAEAELFRERWYWTDRKIAHAARYMRLAFLPLTRRWRLNLSPLPITTAAMPVTLAQNYNSLTDALDAIKRIGRLRLADAADLGDDTQLPVAFRFRLDNTQMPRPFQIGVAGQSDWNLSIERSARLPLETLR